MCRLYARNVHNAMALENALLWLMIAAMLLRAAVYGALYFTLPRDARRVKENRAPPKPRDPEAELTGRFLSHLAKHAYVHCRGVADSKSDPCPSASWTCCLWWGYMQRSSTR